MSARDAVRWIVRRTGIDESEARSQFAEAQWLKPEYAVTVAYRACVNIQRREHGRRGEHRVWPILDDPDYWQPAGSDEPGYHRAEAVADLDRILAQLPRQQELILRAHDVEGRTQAEIAAAMGVTPGRVCQLRRQALITAKAVAGRG